MILYVSWTKCDKLLWHGYTHIIAHAYFFIFSAQDDSKWGAHFYRVSVTFLDIIWCWVHWSAIYLKRWALLQLMRSHTATIMLCCFRGWQWVNLHVINVFLRLIKSAYVLRYKENDVHPEKKKTETFVCGRFTIRCFAVCQASRTELAQTPGKNKTDTVVSKWWLAKKTGEICSMNLSYIPTTVLYMSGRPVAKCEPKLSWATQHDPWSHPTDDSALGKWEHMLLIRSILKYCVNNWKTILMINQATKKRFGWSIFQSWLFWWRPMYRDFYPQHCIYEFEFEFELNYIFISIPCADNRLVPRSSYSWWPLYFILREFYTHHNEMGVGGYFFLMNSVQENRMESRRENILDELCREAWREVRSRLEQLCRSHQ